MPHDQSSEPSPATGRVTRLAATIGVHGDEAQGWWAITDAGARVFVPTATLDGWRTLRNGQRVHLELDADTATVVRTTPPHA